MDVFRKAAAHGVWTTLTWAVVGVGMGGWCAAQEPTEVEERVAKEVEKRLVLASQAARAGQWEEALEWMDDAVKLAPERAMLYTLRGRIQAARGKGNEAIEDFSKALAKDPKAAQVFDDRGVERFKLGQVDEASNDFDQAVKLDPRKGREHWRRGIAYYYAGRYEEGKKQFEMYQEFDDSDVENAVWRFLCMAQTVGVDEARKGILKIGDDRRVPMRQVYELFAGRAAVEDVLKAAETGEEAQRGGQRFYAHQYVGLYLEATGDPVGGLKHIQQSLEHPIPHYMFQVSKVHAALRKANPKPHAAVKPAMESK